MPEFLPAATVEAMVAARLRGTTGPALLVALSGIDGSGKGYVAARVAERLRAAGTAVAEFNVDGFLSLPAIRFGAVDPARHFYEHAIRFDATFCDLVEPPRRDRRIDGTLDDTEETATAYRPQRSVFHDVDVILVEGIYLLKRELRPRDDRALWLDCSFDTALERALARSQEGLSRDETIRAYRTLYFPAQEIHFERDRPREGADAVIANDPRHTAAP